MNEWDMIAPYYDDLFSDRVHDIPFWTGLARQFGSPVLELACGTGRITVPLAKTGIRVTGVDISGPMLAKARKNARLQPAAVSRNISFRRADIFNFSLPFRTFRAVISPWGFLPVTAEEQAGHLASVRRHLAPGGYFVLDFENIPAPDSDWSFTRIREYKRIPRKGITLLRQAFNTGSAATRLGRIVFTLDVIKNDGSVRRIVTERHFRQYTTREIIGLLEGNGFDVISMYGDYDFSPWHPSSSLSLIVSRLSSGRVSHAFRSLVRSVRYPA